MKKSHTDRSGGFTLIELVTVMGIMAVLVALVVGAGTAISEHWKRETTIETIRLLDAALMRYYEDWGRYPWLGDPSKKEIMDAVDETAGTGYAPIPSARAYELPKNEAMLFAILNMRQRRGPYMSAGAGQTVEFNIGANIVTVYVDGWGRPIQYFEPEGAVTRPRLMSEGPGKDFRNDTESQKDNIYNYGDFSSPTGSGGPTP